MPAKKESFLLVSLNEDKAKELAQVVTNDTCRNILDFLADGEAAESDIAKKMKLPISTVHYNIKQLMKGGLVVADEFHYSQKGKEVLHYKLANKYIIIAPKSTWGLKEKLKKIIPITGIILAASVAVELAVTLLSKTSSLFAAEGTASADMAVQEIASKAMLTAEETVFSTPSPVWQYAGLWFLVGGLFAIIVYLFVDWLRNR